MSWQDHIMTSARQIFEIKFSGRVQDSASIRYLIPNLMNHNGDVIYVVMWMVSYTLECSDSEEYLQIF